MLRSTSSWAVLAAVLLSAAPAAAQGAAEILVPPPLGDRVLGKDAEADELAAEVAALEPHIR